MLKGEEYLGVFANVHKNAKSCTQNIDIIDTFSKNTNLSIIPLNVYFLTKKH